tara:strand:+ start:338 stop:970 length:633 start_codon:yes stop_codon:yes gene_type:complete
MERIGLAGAALVSAALLGASAPSIGPDADSRFVSARALSGNDINDARISDVNGRAIGTLERLYLNGDGAIEALKIEWRAGLTDNAIALVQPIDRFSYDPGSNVLVADANYATLSRWADENRQSGDEMRGVSVDVVGAGLLNGALVQSADGAALGRVVQVLEDEGGTANSLIYVSQSGWLSQRASRHAVPVDGARWFAEDRTVTLPTRVEI